MNFKKECDPWDLILVLIGLMPVYLGEGYSVNYTYIFIPFLSRNIKLKIPKYYLIFLFSFFFIYFLSFLYVNIHLVEKLDRSLISFMLFISPFFWGGFEINKRFYNSLMLGILIFSTSFTIWQIFTVLYNLLFLKLVDFYSLKDIIGSNRISFIIICAYFIAGRLVSRKNLLVIRTIFIIGILFTFSRAALITFIASVLFELLLKKKLFKFRTIVKLSITPTILGVFLYYFFPGGEEIISFFKERILERFTDNNYNLTSRVTSEGIRIETWIRMIQYLEDNFLLFTGTGFLGPWILPNLQVASSHNQFIDVLFRSGIIGIILVYAPLLHFILSRKRDTEFRVIVFILLFYGIFHESFKETQGAFLLAIIFSTIFNPTQKHQL